MAFELKTKGNKNATRPVVTAGISVEEDAIIKQECADLNMSRSNFVRSCLADYFVKKSMEVGN